MAKHMMGHSGLGEKPELKVFKDHSCSRCFMAAKPGQALL